MVKLIKFISTEEFRKILKVEKNKKYMLSYILAFGSGLRISEIAGLREEICPECSGKLKDTFTIGEFNKKGKKKVCIDCKKIWPSIKCKRSKDVWKIPPLEAEQVNLQTNQIKVFGKGQKERITVINPLFPIREHMLKMLPLGIPRTTLQRRFRILTERVLKRKLNFHVLRHGFANHFLNERDPPIPMPMVQGFGGWARLDTVGIYARANPQQAVNKVWEGF